MLDQFAVGERAEALVFRAKPEGGHEVPVSVPVILYGDALDDVHDLARRLAADILRGLIP